MHRYDIMFLIRSMGRGGAERQLSLLARALHARGLKVCVAVFYAGGDLEQELRDAGIPILDLKKAGRWSNFGMIRRLVHFVRQYRPRVLHPYLSTQNVQALLLRPLLRRMDCSVACGIRTSLKNAWQLDKATGIVDLAQALLLPAADCVISNSTEAYRQWKKRCGAGRGHVVPNGIECQNFSFSAEKRRLQRHNWGIGDGEILVGMVGRIDTNKNQALLLQAAPHVALAKSQRIKFVFAGTGSPEAMAFLEEKIAESGIGQHAILAGQVSDMAATYSAIDIFCLCSANEGFPNVLAEAMCVGLPCVSTDAGDARQIIGDCGWVVRTNDPVALGAAIADAITALPSWERAPSRQRVLENFSVDALAERSLMALAPLLRDIATSEPSKMSRGYS